MPSAAPPRPPRLVADIGATNARFAALDGSRRRTVVLATASFESARALFAAALEALEVERVAACCAAVAGPVFNGTGAITNGTLEFDENALSRQLGAPVLVVNDFYALAMALPRLEELRKVGGGQASAGPRVVLGPGTGLGVSFLLPDGDGWRVVPSEAGHADLAPGNLLELEVLSLLHQQHRAVCWETVLSGPGLVNLHRAVSAIWGSAADELTPEEIAARGAEADDPVCHQTLELFLGWLGAAAGNLALTVCARGGVFIGGGIVPALGEMVTASPLRRRFEERAGLEELVRNIPLYVITAPDPGLVGAEACLDARTVTPACA